MTQKSVEIVIGKLASDEDLRRRFRNDRAATLRALQEEGFELTAVEVASLAAVEPDAFERLAAALDPRVRKASLGAANGPDGQAKESA